MSRQAKIGLLGGTFDPPHWGHLWLAELARVQLGLHQVLFLPVGHPPHKTQRSVTAAAHRVQMISLATQDSEQFKVDLTDYHRPPPHSTVSLLPLLEKSYGKVRFWLLMGGDSLRDLPTWREPKKLITFCRLAVLARPGAQVDWPQLETAVPGIRSVVDELSGPTLSLSASAIRQWVKAGHTPRYLLPPAVLEYLERHRLYREDGP